MPVPIDLWTLIANLGADLPFTQDKLARQLGVSLHQVSDNGFFTFFEGGPIPLANGIVIETVDLRLRHQREWHSGLLRLTLGGRCLPLLEIKRYYSGLVLSDIPRGHSLHDVTSLTTNATWGTLSFSFPVSNEHCVSTISFNPKPL